MRQLAACLALAIIPLSNAAAATDVQCMTDCTQRYTYAYCQNACSYGARQPTYVPQVQIPNFYEEAMKGREAAQRTELLREERRVLEQQRRALELENERRARELAAPITPEPERTPAQSNADTLQKFLAAAAPRRQLYPDFETVAFSKDVQITDDMVWIMAQSPFAADLAYYLGKHPERAAEISQMTLLNQVAEIKKIERLASETAAQGKTF